VGKCSTKKVWGVSSKTRMTPRNRAESPDKFLERRKGSNQWECPSGKKTKKNHQKAPVSQSTSKGTKFGVKIKEAKNHGRAGGRVKGEKIMEKKLRKGCKKYTNKVVLCWGFSVSAGKNKREVKAGKRYKDGVETNCVKVACQH